MTKWNVPLEGGVITFGGYYSLACQGRVVVEANDADEAKAKAEKWLDHAFKNGNLIPDDGLDLEIKGQIEPNDEGDEAAEIPD